MDDISRRAVSISGYTYGKRLRGKIVPSILIARRLFRWLALSLLMCVPSPGLLIVPGSPLRTVLSSANKQSISGRQSQAKYFASARVLLKRTGGYLFPLPGLLMDALSPLAEATSREKKWKLDLTATDYQSIQLWDADTGRLLRTFGAARWSNQVAWSPDGRYIASAEPNHVVNIWEAATGQRVGKYAGHTEAVRTVAWSPDGSMIASGGNDCTVHLWIWNPRTHTADLSFIYRGHTHTVLTLAWSPEGACIASAGADKTV
jgi:hypothetical protein